MMPPRKSDADAQSSPKPQAPSPKRRKVRWTKDRIAALLSRLGAAYPVAECALTHRNAFELLIATILSAQCTDKMVNTVTPALFERFPTPAALTEAEIEEVERLIKRTGFYHNKAKNIIGAARELTQTFGGVVPSAVEPLLTLPGVARKTANVVLGVWYKQADGVVVDTHVKRIAGLLGLTTATDPVKIERELMELLPREAWIDFTHRIITHGREVCIANRPQCPRCPLAELCASAPPA